MDLAPLITELSDTKAKLTVSTDKLTTAEAALAATQTRITELEASTAGAPAVAEQLTASQAQVTALQGHLTAVFSHVAAMTGDATATAPEAPEALVEALKGNVAKLKLSGNRTSVLDAASGTGSTSSSPGNAAFRRRA